MDKTEADIIRANRAKLLLEDPLMIEANEYIEAEMWRMFKTLAPTDTEGITHLKAMQYFHGKYSEFLNKVINQGKIARLELERQRPRPNGY